MTNKIYVLSFLNNGSVSVIDGGTNTVLSTTGIPTNPSGLGIHPLTNKIYVATFEQVTVIDGATDTVVTTIASPTPQLAALAVDSATNKIYAFDQRGNVYVIDGTLNTIVATITTMPLPPFGGPVTNVNVVTNTIHDASIFGDTVIDGATNNVTATVTIPQFTPLAAAVNPLTNKIYLAGGGANGVYAIDGATNAVTTPTGFPILSKALAIAINPLTNTIYAVTGSNGYGNFVAVISGSTASVSALITAGSNPSSVTVNPVTNRVYVADELDGEITVIDGATNY